jgi:hypothetical protein
MFENRIEEQVRQLLLGHLNALWDYGWRSVLLSEQFATFPLLRHVYIITPKHKQDISNVYYVQQVFIRQQHLIKVHTKKQFILFVSLRD